MDKKPAKLCNRRQLTKFLRQIAAEAETINDEGGLITKGEVLARLVFKRALGYTEVDPKDKTKEVYHKPEFTAMQLIFERIEGRVPQAVPDDKGGMTAAKKVQELERKRVNSVTDSLCSIPPPPRRVGRSNNGTESSEGTSEKPGVEK